MLRGKGSAESSLASFNLDSAGVNHHPSHHFSHEVQGGGRGGAEPLIRSFQGCCNELLSQCRRVFWQAELIHDILGRPQKGPQPEGDLTSTSWAGSLAGLPGAPQPSFVAWQT